MDKLRILGLYVLILAAGIYAGIKAYVYFSVQGELDDLATRIRPFVNFTYGGISSGLEGSLTIEGVEVRIPGRVLPVRIRALSLEGEGPRFLFDAAAGFGADRIPPRMRIALQGAELPEVRDLVPAGATPATSARADPCSLSGLLQRVGSWQTESLPLVLDLSLEYHIDLASGFGRMSLEYRLAGGDSLQFEAELTRLSRPGVMLLGMLPRIERIVMSMRPDPQRARALVSECAQRANLSAGAFLDSLLTRPASQLADDLGFLPGPGLREALRRGLANPRELVLELGPVDDPAQVQATVGSLTPEQLVRSLGVRLSVNGEPVDDLSFQAGVAADTPYPRGAEADGVSVQPRRRQPARMLDTPVTELGRYLGRDVNIFVSGRERPHVGILTRVTADQVSVEQRLLGGSMAVHLESKDIVRVQVMRYPPADGE